MHGDPMDTMPNLCRPGRELVLGFQPSINRLPGLAAVIGPKHAGRRDGDENSLGSVRVQQRWCAATFRPRPVARDAPSAPQAGKFLPGPARRPSS